MERVFLISPLSVRSYTRKSKVLGKCDSRVKRVSRHDVPPVIREEKHLLMLALNLVSFLKIDKKGSPDNNGVVSWIGGSRTLESPDSRCRNLSPDVPGSSGYSRLFSSGKLLLEDVYPKPRPERRGEKKGEKLEPGVEIGVSESRSSRGSQSRVTENKPHRWFFHLPIQHPRFR